MLVIIALLLSACAVTHTPPIYRIALLAPFEGRYAEIGYNALYAARLAFTATGVTNIELMAVDDGGSVETAVLRARALSLDPQVIGALVLGYQSSDPAVQVALGDIPVLIVGRWTDSRAAENVFILSSRDIHTPLDPVTAQIDVPYEGGDVWMLEGARRLRESLDGITVVTSGSPADADFVDWYRVGNAFAPEPNQLAMLSYDAAAFLIQAAGILRRDRASTTRWLTETTYNGTLSGDIKFESDGYWSQAPINRYRFENGAWSEADS
ncbi:MAG: hypothetical protein IAE80_26200 [Anaerolinea sp.]|nr:hypothetical protein [Anaerolinea sp.]